MPQMKTIGTMKFVSVPELFLRLAIVRRRLFAAAFVCRGGLFRVVIIFIHLQNKEEVSRRRRKIHKGFFAPSALFCGYLIFSKLPKFHPKAA